MGDGVKLLVPLCTCANEAAAIGISSNSRKMSDMLATPNSALMTLSTEENGRNGALSWRTLKVDVNSMGTAYVHEAMCWPALT